MGDRSDASATDYDGDRSSYAGGYESDPRQQQRYDDGDGDGRGNYSYGAQQFRAPSPAYSDGMLQSRMPPSANKVAPQGLVDQQLQGGGPQFGGVSGGMEAMPPAMLNPPPMPPGMPPIPPPGPPPPGFPPLGGDPSLMPSVNMTDAKWRKAALLGYMAVVLVIAVIAFGMVSYLYVSPFVGTKSLKDGSIEGVDIMVRCCSTRTRTAALECAR